MVALSASSLKIPNRLSRTSKSSQSNLTETHFKLSYHTTMKLTKETLEHLYKRQSESYLWTFIHKNSERNCVHRFDKDHILQ